MTVVMVLLKINGQRMYEVTSDFLEKEAFRTRPHTGIDLAMKQGTDLFSPVEGVVTKIVNYHDANIGKGVFIKTPDNQTLILGHLNDIDVKQGALVKIGQKLGESGNTGNVVGNGHLHIGLKDASGNFIDPSHIEKNFQEVAREVAEHGGGRGVLGEKLSGTVSIYKDFMNYIQELKTEGFFMATFDKTPQEFFFGWLRDGSVNVLEFVLENDEAFIILPAFAIMFLTFLIGKNKYTKWVVPLWLLYFATSILTQATGLMEWLAKH